MSESQHSVTVTLHYLPDSDGAIIDMVARTSGPGCGSTVSFGASPVRCDTNEQRLNLALLHAFATRVEREYARLESAVFTPAKRCWTMIFDMSGYLDALARL